MIAASHGFRRVTAKSIARIAKQLKTAGESQALSKKEEADYLFCVLLVITMGRQGRTKQGSPNSLPLLEYDNQKASEFYNCAKNNEAIQLQLAMTKNLDDFLKVVRSHGLALEKIDILMHRHQWREAFFPWAQLSPKQSQQFVQSSHAVTKKTEILNGSPKNLPTKESARRLSIASEFVVQAEIHPGHRGTGHGDASRRVIAQGQRLPGLPPGEPFPSQQNHAL